MLKIKSFVSHLKKLETKRFVVRTKTLRRFASNDKAFFLGGIKKFTFFLGCL